jgi:hypothetical protein
MREISHFVQIVKQAKKKCVDYTVRTDADVAGPYDTWQVRTTNGRCWLVVG